MKKFFLFLSVAFALCMVSCNKLAEGEYVINGTVENGGEGATLYLLQMDDGFNAVNVDSAIVKDGKFSFAGKLEAYVESRILSDKSQFDFQNPNVYSMYIESAEMTLVVPSIDSLENATLTGSQTQDEINDFETISKDLHQSLMKASDDFYATRASGDTIATAKAEKLLNELGEQYRALQTKWMEEHPQAYYTFLQKSMMVSSMNLESVDSLLSAFPEKFKGTDAYNSVETELNNLKKAAPGAPATDFADTDINGKPFKLSDLKGNYIILDFWASWCVPCRASMPHVKALYEKYKDKGLKVVCVSDDDSNEDKWKEAVKKDGTEEFYHVLRGLKRTATGYDKSEDKSESYAVHYLPTKYLVGPDFKIVSKVDDEELEAELEKAYGF